MEKEEEKLLNGFKENGNDQNAVTPRCIGDYKIIKTIGTGTFGKVVLALKDDEPVAIKKLKKKVVI